MHNTQNIRYRTEDAFGEGYREFETFELGNFDLLTYFLRRYKDADITVKNNAKNLTKRVLSSEQIEESEIRAFFI